MVKPVFRRKSIGTKVSEEEYASAGRRPGARRVGARGSVPRVGRERRRGPPNKRCWRKSWRCARSCWSGFRCGRVPARRGAFLHFKVLRL